MPSEIGVRLTGDNSEFRSMLSDSVARGQQFATEVAMKTADKLVGLRDVSRAVATALGLNFEKIADNIASLLTGLSESSRESLERLADLSTQIAERNIAAMRALIPLEDQYKLALLDRERIQTRLGKLNEEQQKQLNAEQIARLALLSPAAALAALIVRRSETERLLKDQVDAQTDQLKNAAEIERLRTEEKKKQLEIANVILEYNKNELTHAADLEGYAAQMSALEQSLVESKERLAKADAGSLDQAKALLQVQKDRFAVDDLQLKHEQAGRLSIQQQEEAAFILAKARQPLTEEELATLQDIASMFAYDVDASGNLNAAEQIRLQIFRLQTEEKKNQRDLDELLRKGVENLTPEELHHVELVRQQNIEYEKQIAAKQQLLSVEEDRGKAEKDSGDFMQRQTEIQALLAKGIGNLSASDKDRLAILAGQNSVLQQQISIIDDLTRQFDNFRTSITRTGETYEQQSTASLIGVKQRLEDQLNKPMSASGRSLADAASDQNDFGSYVTASVLRGELDAVTRELNLRAQINAYAAKYGQTAAITQFGDTDTQRAFRDLQDTSTQTSQALKRIADGLSNSGIISG